MSNGTRFRAKYKNSRGQAFNKLRKVPVIDKATNEQVEKLKELGIEIEKNLTEIRAKYLIRETIKAIKERELDNT